MLRSNCRNNNMSDEYYNIHQMAVAGDVLEDFVVIFRDMMSRVCKFLKIKKKIKTMKIVKYSSTINNSYKTIFQGSSSSLGIFQKPALIGIPTSFFSKNPHFINILLQRK